MPVDQLRARRREIQRDEHFAEQASAEARLAAVHFEQRFAPRDFLGVAAHPPSGGETVDQDELAHALGVARGISDRGRGAVGDAEQVEMVGPGRIDHRLQIADHRFEIELRRIPFGQAEPAHVGADQAVRANAFAQPVTVDRARPVMVEVGHPGRRLDQREAFAALGIGNPRAIGSGARRLAIAVRGWSRVGMDHRAELLAAVEEIAAQFGEHRPRRLGLEQDVVAAFERNEAARPGCRAASSSPCENGTAWSSREWKIRVGVAHL